MKVMETLLVLMSLLLITCHCSAALLIGEYSGTSHALGPNTPSMQEDICVSYFHVYSDQIIKPTESKARGAVFLNNSDVSNPNDCLLDCCATPDCNVAVLEEKPHSVKTCYMFNCGPLNERRCTFTADPSFQTAILQIDRSDFDAQLIRSALNRHFGGSNRLIQSPPVKTQVPTDVVPVVAKKGRPIQSQIPLQTSGNVVQSACSRFQFQCRNSTECIGLYNTCDGIPQCPDGSDEDSNTCGKRNKLVWGEQKPQLQSQTALHAQTGFNHPPPAANGANEPLFSPQKEVQSQYGSDVMGTYNQRYMNSYPSTGLSSRGRMGMGFNNNKDQTSNNLQPQIFDGWRSQVQNAGDARYQPLPDRQQPQFQAVTRSPPPTPPKEEVTPSASPAVVTQQVPLSSSALPPSEYGSELSRLALQTATNNAADVQPGGAVLVLVLGLTFTLLVATVLTCHYRNRRRGSVRGFRGPGTRDQDPDYLVNGLYL